MNVPRATYSFRTSFWAVPETFSRATPCLSATATYIATRIGAGALIVIEVETRSSGIPSKTVSMSASESIATPDLAHLAGGALVVGVEAHLGGQVERGGEARLALGEQELEALVGRLGRAEPGVLADRPRPRAVHRRLDAARERVLAREAEVARRSRGRRRARACRCGRSGGRRGSRTLAALAGLLQRLRERALLPAPARVVQALELLLLGADQLVELGLAVAAGAVACVRHCRWSSAITRLLRELDDAASLVAAPLT